MDYVSCLSGDWQTNFQPGIFCYQEFPGPICTVNILKGKFQGPTVLIDNHSLVSWCLYKSGLPATHKCASKTPPTVLKQHVPSMYTLSMFQMNCDHPAIYGIHQTRRRGAMEINYEIFFNCLITRNVNFDSDPLKNIICKFQD